jgi:sirohydrochlorin cobaltochelatase
MVAPATGSSMSEGLLLVGHGSRSAAGQADMEALATGVSRARGARGVTVELGYLELCDPPAGVALDRLVERGVSRVVVLPLMLHAAGHSKSDVPALVLEGRHRHPGVVLTYGRPFGIDHALLEAARRRIDAVGGTGQPLALISRGTSDPDANGDAYKVARLLAECTSAPLVNVGFSGVTWPTVADCLDQLHRLGAERIVAFMWFLATGVLMDRIDTQLAAMAERAGVEMLSAGYLGRAPGVIDLVIERYREAASGPVWMNCDACSYRRPFPGLEDRVAQPLGVGHSHLAVAHRDGGHHHH